MRMTRGEQKTANVIAKAISILVWIVIRIVKLFVKLIYKLRKIELKLLLLIMAIYLPLYCFQPIAHAPKASAVLNGEKPFITKTDYKVKEIVLSMGRLEFGDNNVEALDELITHESGFDPTAVNPNSGACGLFQALPCSKMASMDLEDQISFGFNYIKNRYGTPNKAWAFWNEQSPHWY